METNTILLIILICIVWIGIGHNTLASSYVTRDTLLGNVSRLKKASYVFLWPLVTLGMILHKA
ncbi:MAG: hypothetical protein JWM20_377 [Patescibacteria group bacterium]|nr:hypothetical protein [Patescibacteria group bacterium]